MIMDYKKVPVNIYDIMGDIMKGVKKGVALTTKCGERVNSMTISWGTVGILWHKPIFTAFIRQSRFTHKQLLANPEFTISIPAEGAKSSAKYNNRANEILKFIGSKSGYEVDKVSALGLNLIDSDEVSVPGIADFSIVLECRVVYKQDQDKNEIPAEFMPKWYPIIKADEGTSDFHTAFIGEILSAYYVKKEN